MTSAPPPGRSGAHISFELAEPGGVKRLLGGRKGPHVVTMAPAEIVVEHATGLQAPLRFAPGAVTVATVDPGPAEAGKGAGRFPILYRIAADRTIPRDMGVEGWLWTARDGSACTLLGPDAPNVALLFSPPLVGERVTGAFGDTELAELAKRSPHGDPALMGLLLRAHNADAATQALSRFGMLKDVTDRDVPPTQRRHLPDDKAANPALGANQLDRASGSVPPPGMSS